MPFRGSPKHVVKALPQVDQFDQQRGDGVNDDAQDNPRDDGDDCFNCFHWSFPFGTLNAHRLMPLPQEVIDQDHTCDDRREEEARCNDQIE